jgi:ferredoxin
MVTFYRLEIPREIVTKPVVSDAITETGASINILTASIDEMQGEMIVDVTGDGQTVAEFVGYLKERGAFAEELTGSVSVKVDGCTHCGACVSVCPVRAITLTPDYEMALNQGDCISCLVCVPVCPMKAIQAPPV